LVPKDGQTKCEKMGGREREKKKKRKTSVTKQSGRCRIVDGMQSRIKTGLGH
jgi:hypothetical protein